MNSSNPRDLPTDRLSTSDKQGRRIYLYPAIPTGRFHRLKGKIHAVLVLIFLTLPWVRINGHQAILLDIANRRFSIFGLLFWAHDAPMLVFVFGGAFLMLGLMTALWGRVWCGWACPQTVFIEAIFRGLERQIEGDHIARKLLDEGDWSLTKVYKKSLKWSAFTLLTLIVSHSFIAYFVGTAELGQMIRHSPSANPSSFAFMLGITGFILFNFGWFREQFCTVVCPYGRFQSLLMDEHSTLVCYDSKRGEPRRGSTATEAPAGDCVNCYRCVQVCPTGIDIRRGAQMECIACTACIDACDDVMTKTNKAKGLIRYDSELGLKGSKTKILRSRTIAYFILIAGTVLGFSVSIATRKPLEATIVRATDTPYQEIPNTHGKVEIINRFKIDLSNQGFNDVELDLTPLDHDAAKGVAFVYAEKPIRLKAGKKAAVEFFVKFPKQILSSGHAKAQLNILEKNNVVITEELNLVGPFL